MPPIRVSCRLARPNGHDLSLDCFEPPLAPDVAQGITGQVRAHLNEEFLDGICRGEHSPEAAFRVCAGRADGRVIGTAWCGWGRDLPHIAVVGGVTTAEAFRGMGVASALMGMLCDQFQEAGGRLLYLATANPAARRIYERIGFRQVVGQVLCRAFHGAELNEGFAARGPLTARDVSPRHIAALLPLYMAPHPCALLDAGMPFPSTRLAGPWRCVRIFWDTWAATQQGGRWRVVENSAGWPVASAIARPANAEGFLVDFLSLPRYSKTVVPFFEQFLERLGASAEWRIADNDEWKAQLAPRLGFRDAGPAGTVDVEGRRFNLQRYVRG